MKIFKKFKSEIINKLMNKFQDIKTAVILCGGRGTRLGSVQKNT